MPLNGIEYVHLRDLGGRRKTNIDSHNTGWRVAAFRGYADYMETEMFTNAIKELEFLGKKNGWLLCVPKPYGGVATAHLFQIF